MEEGVFPPDPVLLALGDNYMDLDYMDELLLEGYRLEAAPGSEFLQHSPSTSNPLFDPSFMWPALEDNYSVLSGSPLKQTQEERQRSSFPENLSISRHEGQNSTKGLSLTENNDNAVKVLCQTENYSAEGSELSRRLWIGPRASTSVMERLIHALGCIKDQSGDKSMLIQIWLPVNRGGKRVLVTNDQPFSLNCNCSRLALYRDISKDYEFTAEEGAKEIVGLPGRVFTGKVPEWTPDVRYFEKEEYPRVDHAQEYDVRGTLAVPVFEQGSGNCLGVIEVVLTTQKINYSPEIESVRKALEAVDLGSCKVPSFRNVKACDLSYQAALPEILEVLKSACVTHGLPLGQTWVPCIQQGKEGTRHSEENLARCVSTVDSACYVADREIWGFHDACSEHHLFKGQGVAGKAFTTNQPCFSHDITSYTKTEYPLSHHARMLGLCAAVAIRLRCTCTGSADFVLEFFLPKDCRDTEQQKRMLHSLSTVIQKVCRNLRVITEKELQEETVSAVDEVAIPSITRVSNVTANVEHTDTPRPHREILSNQVEVQDNASGVSLFQNGKPGGMVAQVSEFIQHQPDSSSKTGVAFSQSYTASGEGSLLSAGKAGEKRRKAEKIITLQVLRQYFAGSLKDAAKSLGVCPTTLKRICRLHGIKRWPSRKIKKVGHSLQKIQRVIDSVQGASGTLQIESFYSNFPELASPNLSKTNPFTKLNSIDHAKPPYRQPECAILSPQAAASKSPSSSCSQNSSSSPCCSTGTQPHPPKSKVSGHDGRGAMEDYSNCELKRARSEAKLLLSNDGSKLMPRSHSHKSLAENTRSENIESMLKENHQKIQEVGNQRVKVTYGEEKIRFRMQNHWRYSDLLYEIVRRFAIEDTCGFHLKYLDDDSEWVLLTCDADLEECIDVYRSSQSQTIKLSFVRDPEQHIGSSFGSNSIL